LNKIFTENSFKSKLKNLGKFGCTLGIIESPWQVGFNEGDLEVLTPKGVRDIEF
jgi:hypothetical protein